MMIDRKPISDSNFSQAILPSEFSIDIIKSLKCKDGFQDIDIQFAEFIIRQANEDNPYLYTACALVSYSLRNSNICLDLRHTADTIFPVYKSGIELNCNLDEFRQIKLPELNKWINQLEKYPKIISRNTNTPLILDNSNRLYLHRYWSYENNLAQMIKEKCYTDYNITEKLPENIIFSSSNYFTHQPITGINWQQVAIFASLVNNFTLISGGPGTGKTTIVSIILGILIQETPGINIKLCAPTGKAAGRLKESISDELKNLNFNTTTKEKLESIETYTIHRLLKSKRLSPHFHKNNQNRINADILIVDEASMVPLTLFARLFDALPSKTKVILLGDKDQLASVEAGAVLSNIYDASEPNMFTKDFWKHYKTFTNSALPMPIVNSFTSTHLDNCVIELKKSYRFDDTKGIGRIKAAVQSFESLGKTNFLNIAKIATVEFKKSPTPANNQLDQSIIRYIKNLQVNVNNSSINFIDYIKVNKVEDAFKIFSKFRVLCSHHIGIYGVKNLNRVIHSHLFDNSSLPVGLPILIKENNDQLGLYNGDIGLIWKDSKSIKKAYFPVSGKQEFKSVSIHLLPAFDEAFAMTVHKSQGSGFQKVLIVLPTKDSPVLTRELIYTGITRAKKYCEIWANDNIMVNAVSRKTVRNSGLKDKLIQKEK